MLLEVLGADREPLTCYICNWGESPKHGGGDTRCKNEWDFGVSGKCDSEYEKCFVQHSSELPNFITTAYVTNLVPFECHMIKWIFRGLRRRGSRLPRLHEREVPAQGQDEAGCPDLRRPDPSRVPDLFHRRHRREHWDHPMLLQRGGQLQRGLLGQGHGIASNAHPGVVGSQGLNDKVSSAQLSSVPSTKAAKLKSINCVAQLISFHFLCVFVSEQARNGIWTNYSMYQTESFFQIICFPYLIYAYLSCAC